MKAGLSTTTLYLAERAGLISDVTRAKLAKVLGCRPEDLLEPGSVVVGEDRVYRVGDGGELTVVPPGGHPHPTGLSGDPTATRRR